MQPKTILGYSGNGLSLVLETLKAVGEQGPFNIVQNIAVNSEDTPPYLPSGIEINIQPAGLAIRLPADARYIFGVLNPEVKKAVFDFFYQHHSIAEENFFNLFHPSSVIAGSAQMKTGCYVEPLTVVSPFARLGFGVTLNRSVSIGHHSILDDFVTIGPGVHVAGHTCVGSYTSIGIGAVIFDHIRIGKNCKIGGGSVVTKDIPDNVIAWGNPCKVIKNNEA